MRSEPGLEWLEDRKEDWTPLLASKLKFLHDGFAFIVICDDERSWFSEYIIKKINSSTNSRPLLPFFSLLLLSVCRILPLSSAQRFLLFSFVPTVPVFPPWLAERRFFSL